jgi:hypothetical protein
MSYWTWTWLIENAFIFSIVALLTGVVTDALGKMLEQTPGVPYALAYLTFFLIIPGMGFFSDVEDLLIRGLIFSFSVMAFSYYIGDPWESAAAFAALFIGSLIAYAREF